jgi:hypothetical protein
MKKTLCRLLALSLVLFAFACEQPKATVTPDQTNVDFSKARAAYDELMTYNPPETMTYNYRKLMSEAEQAKAKGDMAQAASLAKQAQEQAVLSLKVLRDMVAKFREKLDTARSEIEKLYPVNQNLVKKYWELEGRFNRRDLQGLDDDINALLKRIDQESKLTVTYERKAQVNAPQEYVKQWGDVRIYQEITPDGKLRGVVDTVGNGAKLRVIKIKLFAPESTFYFIETGIGTQGWIAEKYLISEGSKY